MEATTGSIQPQTGRYRSSPAPEPDGCLGRTCLQWTADGELTARDRQIVALRLARADALAPPWPSAMGHTSGTALSGDGVAPNNHPQVG